TLFIKNFISSDLPARELCDCKDNLTATHVRGFAIQGLTCGVQRHFGAADKGRQSVRVRSGMRPYAAH
ncbi:MAG: hypothetical protein DMG71_02335, partial [Acidobacteria bacterium]